MLDRMRTPLLLLLACTLGAVAVHGAARSAAPRGPARVAVVDLFEVLTKAKPFVQAEQELKAWIEQGKRELQALKDDIDKRTGELELFDPEAEDFRRRANDLDLKKLELQHKVDDLERERTRRILDNQRASFERVTKAIAEIATKQAIDLVLQTRSAALSGQKPGEVTSEMYLRDVLYRDAALDITSDVTTIIGL